MESGNGGASSKGVLVPVSDRSDVFTHHILSPLQSAYLYEESRQSFRYKSAVLIKNPELEEKYSSFRAKRKQLGYSEEDLTDTYGFLLFDDVNKANALGETGVLSGNSTCTTLGDPAKGVYISMYSDCLDPNRWYHGKSGYIAIIRLTKGKVKRVFENYTQNFTAPTRGFDCHVSEQLPSVSADTSSFLAFERTQYYMYELLDDGSNETALSPSAACPFAIVSFSYTDTKATVVVQQEKRYFMQRTLFSECCEEKKSVCHYLSWKGQLQVGTQFYKVGLKSTTRTLFLTGKLPPVLKVDRAISMLALRQLLPRTVFETYFSGEVFLDGLYCSLCELVPSDVLETNALSLLVQEVKEKDIALPVSLSDGGFLLLLHSSHFLTYDDIGLNATKVFQGLFVFPESRLIQRDTKFGDRKVAVSSEILRVLPVLSYAEGEVEKTAIDPSQELCEVLVQHMQNYATLINPGLALSPSRDVSIFPDQYDVADAHKHLYLTPEWTNGAWQNFRSYLSKPLCFQLPVSKASELLAAGQEERREDLDDDVYICLSSPEEVQSNPVSMELEDNVTFPGSPVGIGTCVDSCIASAEAHINLTAVPQSVPHDCEADYATKDIEKSGLSVLIEKETLEQNLLDLPPSDDLPAELIVSITSAKRTVTDESLGVISTVSSTKHNDFEMSRFSAVKLKTEGVHSLNDEPVKQVNVDCTKVTNFTKTRRRKLSRGHKRRHKKASLAVTETTSSTIVKIPVEDNISKSQDEKSSDQSQLSNPSVIDWRKLPRRRRKFVKVSSTKKLRSSALHVVSEISQPSTVTMEIEVCTVRKKTLRWDLKPVVSECGRILVPHGSVDFSDQIKCLKDKLSKQPKNDEQDVEKNVLHNASDTCVDLCDTTVHDTVKMDQESCTASEPVEDNTVSSTSNDGVHHLQDTVFSDNNPEQGLVQQLDGDYGSVFLNQESSEHLSKNVDTKTSTLEAVNSKQADRLSLGNCTKKSEYLLSKLKTVLQRGKRKADVLVTERMTIDTAQDMDTWVKKGRLYSDTEPMKSNDAIAILQDSVKEPSNMLSLDPLFAYALGLTPKEKPQKVQKIEGTAPQIVKDLPDKQELPNSGEQPQIVQQPPSIFPRSSRIKTLKKHQGIPEEYIKKKWWLHFQTPACFASAKRKNKGCTRDISVRKTVKEKMNSACSSTDALNLLADLALSANKGQVPQQPEPALEREPETSFKKCDVTKDVTSSEQESVLHTLLRQPASKTIQPLDSPSQSHFAGTEIVDLISKEHAYSLPQSSSLLLGLPGTPFQVPPLCGSTRLLHHHLHFYGNGVQTLQPYVYQDDRHEHNHRSPESLKKHPVHRQKFRHSRTFFNKNGSVQVIRHWKENYDFSLDSKFTSDSKDRTIIRALHGPWDFSVQDTSEEVRLIVHMWIGLFYSRSTARFFQIDSNLTYPEENESSLTLTTASPDQSELKSSSFGLFQHLTDISDSTMSKALDLSKKDTSAFDQGPVILDLSLRNSNSETLSSAPQVNCKNDPLSSEKEASETLNILNSVVGLQEASAFQCYKKMTQSTESISNVIIAKSKNENEISSFQRIDCLENTDISLFERCGLLIPPQEAKRVLIRAEETQPASAVDNMLPKSIEEKTDEIKSSGSTENIFVLKHAKLSKPLTDKDLESSLEEEEVGSSIHHQETESKEKTHSLIKKSTSTEGGIESLEVINLGDNSTNVESNTDCNRNCVENEEPLLTKEPIAVAPGQAENIDGDSYTVKKDTVIEDDYSGKEHGLDDEDGCISSVTGHSNFSDELLHLNCDTSESVTKDCITDKALCNEQPSQENNEEEFCHDLQLQKRTGNTSLLTDKHNFLEETLQTQSELELVGCESVGEENSERKNCLADKAQYGKAALLTSDEDTHSLHETCAAVPLPQTKDNVEPEGHDLGIASVKFKLSTVQETKPVELEMKDDTKVQQVQFHNVFQSPHEDVFNNFKPEETLTKEDPKMDKTKEGFEKSNRVVIPFIGIDISGEDGLQPHDSHPQGNVEEHVQDHIKIQFISETRLDLPVVASTSQVCNEKTKLSGAKIPLHYSREANQSLIMGCESDDRCPTPTMDEKPYDYISVPTIRNSTSVKEEISMENKHNHKSLGNGKLNPHLSLHSDLETRTQQVLQCIDKLFSKPNQTDKSYQLETAFINHNLAQINPKPSNKHMPPFFSSSQVSNDCKDKQVDNTKSEVVSPSTSQELRTKSPEHHLLSPFKLKLEEVLGVRLNLKTDLSVPQHYFQAAQKKQERSVGQDFCITNKSPTHECLQDIKPNIEQERNGASQNSLSHELCSNSRRPVMAVKPSKSEGNQGDHIYTDGQMGTSTKCKETKSPVVTYHTTTSRGKAESLKGNSEGAHDLMHDFSDLTCKSSLLSNVTDCKSNSASTSFVDCKNTIIDDSLTHEPETLIKCTVYNATQQRSCSFLDEVSKRCLQDDPTRASIEQEQLIFYEQIKQLLKISERPICEQEAHEKSKSSCPSPMVVQFSKLEEQDDSLDYWDASLFVGQKIKVDMSNRKDLTEVKKKPEPQETGSQMAHAGIYDGTEECARLYESMMNDVCSVKKVLPRSKFFRMDGVNQQTEQQNHFDFCDQMKREMDDTFHSNLNSVVKKSCKRKYRFYMLVTSDNSFFEETKVELEAQGHTAIDQSELFFDDDCTSLLIIIRNEDIAEHICKVPHLLELKKSPGVQFAGVDEPDDVVNLTYQELFTRGGFIMFDRAALESLSFCNMKKCAEILQELSRTGKWKWMLHYRDSRRLKENARLSVESKQKTHFLNWCQDTGILEVLPYHDCDLITKDQPDYLTCLVRLQVQNISARYPVFITETTTNDAFGRNGVFTMTVNSFLTNFSGKILENIS